MGRTVNSTTQVKVDFESIAKVAQKKGVTFAQLCRACGKHGSWFGKARKSNSKMLYSNDLETITKILGKPDGYFLLDKVPEKVKLDVAKLKAEADKYEMFLKPVGLLVGEPNLENVDEVTEEVEEKICKLFNLEPKSLIKVEKPMPEPIIDIATDAKALADLNAKIAQIHAILSKPKADVVAKITDNYLEIASMVEQTINKKFESLKPLQDFAQLYMDNHYRELFKEYLDATKKTHVTERDVQHLFGNCTMDYKTKIAESIGGVRGQTTGFDKVTYWDFK